MGPKIVPPPLQRGDLRDPARALPVPFCLQGFAPPPRTRALILGARRPFSLGGEIHSNDIIEKRRIDLRIEDPIIQFDIAHFLISNVIDG